MSYFSAFWKKRYPEIGFCCILHPFENITLTGGVPMTAYIDTSWMKQNKLKYVGVDKMRFTIWIMADGTVLRFRDLQRTEAGKKYEREVERLELPEDGVGDFDVDLEWEAETQKTCGLCPRGLGKKDGGDEKGEEEDKPIKTGDTTGVAGPYSEADAKKDYSKLPYEDAAASMPGVTDYSKVANTQSVTDTDPINYWPKNKTGGYLTEDEFAAGRPDATPQEASTMFPPTPVTSKKKVVAKKLVTTTKKVTEKNAVPESRKGPDWSKFPPTAMDMRKEDFANQRPQTIAAIDMLAETYMNRNKLIYNRVKAFEKSFPPHKRPFEKEQFGDLRPFPVMQTLADTINYKKQRPVKTPNKGLSQKPKVKLANFFVKHQEMALAIGDNDESLNISSIASRFAILTDDHDHFRFGYLAGNEYNPYSNKANAFRHTLWSAAIKSEFGEVIAKEAADAHEEDPMNYWMGPFEGNNKDRLEKADEPIDLWNNIIGRKLVAQNSGKNMKEIAMDVLNEFRERGLFTLVGNRMQLTKLTDWEYELMKAGIDKRDKYGMTKSEYEKYNRRVDHLIARQTHSKDF